MIWLTRLRQWIATHQAPIHNPSAMDKTKREYDEEQRKLADVWRRIARAGQGYLDESTSHDDHH
jgi:hypothetical protein